MVEILFLAYNVLTLGLPVFLALILLYKYAKKNEIDFPMNKIVWIIVFAVYLFMVFSVTGAGSLWDVGHYDGLVRVDEITLLPFTSGGSNYLTYVFNVIMFVPLGFVVPLIWEKARNWRYILALGFSFSLLIELSQLLNIRNTALDDLLMNTLGAAIGYGMFILFLKIRKKPFEIGQQIYKYEPYIFIGAMFLGNFFLYNWRGFAGFFV